MSKSNSLLKAGSAKLLNLVIFRNTLLLLIALSLATLGTLWLVFEVRKEQLTISSLLDDQVDKELNSLLPIIQELKWQLALAFLLLAVLIGSAVMLVIIVREYFISQKIIKSLEQQAIDIIESMEHGILTSDSNGNIIMSNRKNNLILGIHGNPMLKNLCDIDNLHTNLDLSGISQKVLESKESITDRKFKIQKENHPVFLSVDCHLLRGEEGVILGTVEHIRDITQNILLSERMTRMEGYMGLGPVAAGLHHEIKNPLSAISIHLKLLEEMLNFNKNSLPDVQEHIHIVKTEMTKIGFVLDSFKDYAKFEALNRISTDLLDLITTVVKLLAPEAARKSADLIIDHKADRRIRAYIDETRLRQVLINLILNSIQAMERPGNIEISLAQEGGFATISVSDEGAGIHPSLQQHIFEPYFTNKKEGSGMGLAVCRKIARLHDGDLTFVNLSRGTKFILTIPLTGSNAES